MNSFTQDGMLRHGGTKLRPTPLPLCVFASGCHCNASGHFRMSEHRVEYSTRVHSECRGIRFEPTGDAARCVLCRIGLGRAHILCTTPTHWICFANRCSCCRCCRCCCCCWGKHSCPQQRTIDILAPPCLGQAQHLCRTSEKAMSNCSFSAYPHSLAAFPPLPLSLTPPVPPSPPPPAPRRLPPTTRSLSLLYLLLPPILHSMLSPAGPSC